MSEYIITGEQLERLGIPDMFTEQEIVRCKDCEHYDDGCCYAGQWSTASLMPSHRVTPDGFCKWGERK